MLDQSAADIADFINQQRFPLLEPETQGWLDAVDRVRSDLQSDGCSVLSDFIAPAALELLARQSLDVSAKAYFQERKTNVYGSEDDPALPEDHPTRIFMKRSNAFVAADYIPQDFIIKKLYSSVLFKNFLAACFDLKEIYEYADPFGSLVVNVLKPGCEHPWHFDMNEFTVSLLTQQPEAGGEFQYYPNTRTPEDEKIDLVRNIIQGQKEGVSSLNLKVGDLQLFKGRYSVHRVAEIKGEVERHTAIFAYSTIPGIIGKVSRARQLFGRVSPQHIEAEKEMLRSDQLQD